MTATYCSINPVSTLESLSFLRRQDTNGALISGAVVDESSAGDGALELAPGLNALIQRAEGASSLLKALGHEGRLTILCHLLSGPKSVTELEKLLSARQAIVSQQLARLRHEALVTTRREGQAIYYSLQDDKAARLIELLAALYSDG